MIFQTAKTVPITSLRVQKSLARSPCLKKPCSKDIFYQVDKKPSNSNNDTEKRYNTSLIDLPPTPLPPLSNLNGPKQSPWCYLPPPPQANQWLVAVSPSEGLVYKPYTGPSPPSFGLMTPAYGLSLTPSNMDFYNTNPYTIPTSYHQGIGHVFPSTPFFTSYTMPAITKPSCSSSNDASYKENDIKSSKFYVPCNLLPQENYKEGERNKDELPLFPTTPMVQDLGQCREEKGFDDDERIKVIKVVPHNPKLASESAARIFQFIQEERKLNE
ncbi:protein HEADING DATE 3B-like [Rutidosis leptorrhynchoides]|uniref:protein HEADING DATE 3B-like n=1 Tax=Rutidosis leptorrhynchoides TaxID=125765 RepID=UPI003A99B374